MATRKQTDLSRRDWLKTATVLGLAAVLVVFVRRRQVVPIDLALVTLIVTATGVVGGLLGLFDQECAEFLLGAEAPQPDLARLAIAVTRPRAAEPAGRHTGPHDRQPAQSSHHSSS